MGSHQQLKMGEGSKQVRVDNWGIFFLQRLQMFFNKTDYCDLTLQFEGNVQLKVHRLVMNACTEYFRILEESCGSMEDVLIMPPDLQADVVLPIVNFMYTGMLEFHMSIFDKLYKTATLMNITVLTKLLDAQKTPIAPLPKPLNKKNAQIPHTWNLQGKKISAKTIDSDLPAPLPGRKLPVWKRKSAPSGIPHTILPQLYPEPKRHVDPLALFDNTPKPTRFEWPDEDISTLNVFDPSFNDISYTSKPLLIKEDEPKPSTSFDRIKDTPDSTRKSSGYENSFVNIDDVKDYVKEQRIRSNMNEEDEDDVDNDFNVKGHSSLKRKSNLEQGGNKRVRFNVNEKENQKTMKINILPTGKISSDVDHTKIISEVLKKYPNLVKKNKNIRLKILAKTDNMPAKQPVKPKPIENKCFSVADNKSHEGPWRCDKCTSHGDFVLYYLYRKHMTDVHNEKFDSRMCKYCGHKSTKHNMLMYHMYVKHGVKPPPAYNFPKCPLCPYIALSEALMMRHQINHTKFAIQCLECATTFSNADLLDDHILLTGHASNRGRKDYDCNYCPKKFQAAVMLFTHLRVKHRVESQRDGFVNMNDDNLEEDDDEEETSSQECNDNNEYISREKERKDKIKILSDVKLSSMEVPQVSSDSLDQHNLALEPSSEAEALNNVASGIATSLGLVDVVVLDDNQQYILHTDNQQSISGSESEFILPDIQDSRTFTAAQQVMTSEQSVITQSMLHNSDIASTDELVMVLTDHDYGDGNNEMINSENANIVVLYSHPIEGQESQFITSQGNIMLTSQAGLIELRNPNTVVTSTGPHFIGNVPESTENNAIESIEMIQREIDQHPDVQETKQTEEHVKINQGTEPETDTSQQPIKENQQRQCQDVNNKESAEPVSMETQQEDDTIVPLPTTVQAEEEKMDTAEEEGVGTALREEDKSEESTPQEECSPALQEEGGTTSEEDKCEKKGVITQEKGGAVSQEEGGAMLQEEGVISQEEKNKSEEGGAISQEEEIKNAEGGSISQEEAKNEKVVSISQEEEAKNEKEEEGGAISQEEEPDKNEEKTSTLPEENKSNEMDAVSQEEEDKSEGGGAIPQEEDREVVESTAEDKSRKVVESTTEDTQEVSQQTEDDNSVNDEVSTEADAVAPSIIKETSEDEKGTDENSQELTEDDASQESQVEENEKLPQERSDKSARIILEDWEDTDSQQSDPKTNANVNKLIDDWDDDEDDRRS